MDANRERCVKAGKEMYGVLARYTNSEALTTVKSVSEMDRVRAWARLHANYSRRTLGPVFRVQRECMYPKLVKDVGQVRLAIMQWEEKWKVMMSELGEGVKILDLWRMSELLEICQKDVKEQMLLRLDEVGENYKKRLIAGKEPNRRTTWPRDTPLTPVRMYLGEESEPVYQ